MNIAVNIPYKFVKEDSKTSMLIMVEPKINENGKIVWIIRFDNHITYLNQWLGWEKYNSEYKEFYSYSSLVEYLVDMQKDINFVWKKYEEEYKQVIPSPDEIKKLFSSFGRID